jgi:hypothetical protein
MRCGSTTPMTPRGACPRPTSSTACSLGGVQRGDRGWADEGGPGGRVGKAAELAVLVPSSVRWASGSQDLALLRSQRGDPLPFVEGCTLTTAFPRQPVATHGNGFRLV